MKRVKPIIYQLMPRWFTNACTHCEPGGSLAANGVGKLNDINDRVLQSIKRLGVTHVWYTGVIEHATCTDYSAQGIKPCNPHVVKGMAGSPYAIRDYYDIDPDLAVDVQNRMAEFEALVARTHAAGMKVIIDFVPNHVAREYGSDACPAGVSDLGADDDKGMFFSPSNNFYYITDQAFAPVDVDLGEGEGRYEEMPARATGNDCFHASPSRNDWYETVKLNYGVDPWNGSQHFSPIPSTWHKMAHILKFWASKGIDGFRCDMVHMVPVEFWHWVIPQLKHENASLIFIAEIYDVSLYHRYINEGGFDYLYDKVTLYDTLCNILKGNQFASDITGCWQTVDGIREHTLNFLENHDELRIASPQMVGDGRLAIPAAVVSATISGCPFMVYAGQELNEHATDAEGFSGRDGRTTIFDYWSVPSVRRWYDLGQCHTTHLSADERQLRRFYARLLKLCNSEQAIVQGKMFDLMYVNGDTLDARYHYAFLRHHGTSTLLIVANFGDNAAQLNVRIPQHAFDYLQLSEDDVALDDLLGDWHGEGTLQHDGTLAVAVEPHNAVIVKIKKR